MPSLISLIPEGEDQIARQLVLNVERIVEIRNGLRVPLKPDDIGVAGHGQISGCERRDRVGVWRVSENRMDIRRCLVQNPGSRTRRVRRVWVVAMIERRNSVGWITKTTRHH